jgi:hypothetical protein
MTGAFELGRTLLGRADVDSIAPNAQMRYGVVTQVSPLLVQVGAATTAMPCKAVADYFPVLNDYVLVLVQGADRIVVASVLAASAPRSGMGAGAPAGTGLNGDEYWDTTNKRLYRSDGTGWIIMAEPEQSYTAGWSNVTLGTGSTRTGWYQRSNGMIDWEHRLTIGTGGSITGNVSVNTPGAIALAAADRDVTFGTVTKTGVNQYKATNEAWAAGATAYGLLYQVPSGAVLVYNNVSASSPGGSAFGAGDKIISSGRARMNSRYT